MNGRSWIGAVALLSSCTLAKKNIHLPTETVHWSLDRCRLTFDGKLVPLGEGIAEWVKVFGPPSDSVNILGADEPRWKGYWWDSLGISAGNSVSDPPDRIGTMGVYFGSSDDPDIRPREPRGTARFPIRIDGKPFGRKDLEDFISKNFSETSYNLGDQTRFQKYLLDSQMVFSIGPGYRKDKSLRALGFGLDTKTWNSPYRSALAKLDSNCQIPAEQRKIQEEKEAQDYANFLKWLRSLPTTTRDSVLKNAFTPKYAKDPRTMAVLDSMERKPSK